MKKDKRQRKPRKELPLALNIILVLLFSVVYLFFSICLGFEISALLNNSIEEEIGCVYWSLISGIIYMALLFFYGINKIFINNINLLKYMILSPMLVSTFIIDYKIVRNNIERIIRNQK